MGKNIKTPIIISGAEPYFLLGNEIGCILVHGFTDSPKEMRPMADFLHSKGYTVIGIRNCGHGTHIDDLRRTRLRDMAARIEDAYHMIKSNSKIKKIFIIGHSMGAGLTLFTSSYLPFDGVVAMAAPYQLSKENLFSEYFRAIDVFIGSLKRKIQSRNLKERLPGWYWYKPELSRGYIKYNQKPVICNLQLVRAANQIKYAIKKIACPVLLMHSHKDKIVPPDAMQKIYNGLASKDKEMVWFEKSSHMLPIDGERELVFQEIHKFIHKIAKK